MPREYIRYSDDVEVRAAGEEDVIDRLSLVPGELLDDRRLAAPRGMAIEVLSVKGPKGPRSVEEMPE